MATTTPDLLPSIRTLPLSDEAQALFSRAVRIVQQRPDEFAPVAAWLDKHYSEDALRKLCERQYRHGFACRLWLLRRDSATYNRRLAIQRGTKWEQLAWDTINEALHRGLRLDGERPGIWQDRRGVSVDESNVHLVWKWEDEQYRRQFRKIKAERRTAKLSEHDHPDRPEWRLRRAIGELLEAEYPDGDEHVEHSRKIVALAALLMPEPLPVLGELGAWPFASTVDLPATPAGDWLTDELAGDAARAVQGPHEYRPCLLDLRKVGREEVLFVRMPGEARQVQRDFPLDDLLKLLRVAVDDVDAPTKLRPIAKGIGQTAPKPANTDPPTMPDDGKPARTRGRLSKADSESKRASMLATLRAHPSLKDDPGLLAGMVGVSEMTIRRWLDDEQQKYRDSKAANPEPDEE